MQTLLMQLIFYIFSTVLLISSMMVTLTRRSVHAVLWLILAFVATAGLWILIQAEFLGLILIIVYVGAVMTLFLFVVMMLNLNEETTGKRKYNSWLGFGAIFIVMAMILLGLVIVPHQTSMTQAVASGDNLTQLGLMLFSQDALAVELAAVILLVAMVGAIYLTHRRTYAHRKKQVIAEQHKVTKQSRLKIVTDL